MNTAHHTKMLPCHFLAWGALLRLANTERGPSDLEKRTLYFGHHPDDLAQGFVYAWCNLLNGKFYVGSHCGSEYRTYVGSGTLFKHALSKYGIKSFVRYILYVGPDYREKEEEYLRGVNAAKQNWCYNLKNSAEGWQGGEDAYWFRRTLSEEHRRKLSSARKGKFVGENHPMYGRRGVLSPLYGRSASPETKAKLSASLRGRPKSLEHKARVSASKMGNTYTKGRIRINDGSRERSIYPEELDQYPGWTTGGLPRSSETSAKLSASLRGRPKRPETVAKISGANNYRAKRFAAEAERLDITPDELRRRKNREKAAKHREAKKKESALKTLSSIPASPEAELTNLSPLTEGTK